MTITFNAEVVEVKAKKTASVDKEIVIRFVTDNAEAMKLQSAIAEAAVRVSIDIPDTKQ